MYKAIKIQLRLLLSSITFFLVTVGQTVASTAITDVTLIDAINGVRNHQTVIIEGDTIVAIQNANKDFSATQIISGEGQYLIPGLWDFHVHLSYDEAFTESMPALFLSYGITSVRDTGGLMEKLLPVVKKMRAKGAISPRVFFAGPLLDGTDVVYDGNSRPEIGTQNTSAEGARQTIAKLKKQGIDFIKIYEMVSPEVFAAMVKVANDFKLPIDAHIPLSMSAGRAGAQVNSMEHLRNVELDCAANADELLQQRRQMLENPKGIGGATLRATLHRQQRLKAIANYDEQRCNQTLDALHKTVQVPTLRLNVLPMSPPFMRNDWQDMLSRLPDNIAKQWRQINSDDAQLPDTSFAQWSLFLTGEMHKRGIPIAAGTDTPIGLAAPGYSLHSELEMLVRAGLSPLDAIASATLRPAEYFSLEGEMGSIDIGKKADMVLLTENPLEAISNTREIALVISKGQLLSPQTLSQLLKGLKMVAP